MPRGGSADESTSTGTPLEGASMAATIAFPLVGVRQGSAPPRAIYLSFHLQLQQLQLCTRIVVEGVDYHPPASRGVVTRQRQAPMAPRIVVHGGA
jgi:hypothetical protein